MKGKMRLYYCEKCGAIHFLISKRDMICTVNIASMNLICGGKLRKVEFASNTERDYPEDYAQDNGYYRCLCYNCGKRFSGNKHRVVCKVCSSKK